MAKESLKEKTYLDIHEDGKTVTIMRGTSYCDAEDNGSAVTIEADGVAVDSCDNSIVIRLRGEISCDDLMAVEYC